MPYPNGRYEDAPYHHQNSKGSKSPAPQNGQKALDKSVPVYDSRGNTKRVRISICDDAIVILKPTGTNTNWYHGYVCSWHELTEEMKNTLKFFNLVQEKAGKGKINYAAKCSICHK